MAERTHKTFEELFQILGIDLKGRKPEDVPRSEIEEAYKPLTRKLHESKFIGAPEAERLAAAERLSAVNAANTALKSPESIAKHRANMLREDMHGRVPSYGARWPNNGAGPHGPSGWAGSHRHYGAGNDPLDDLFRDLFGNMGRNGGGHFGEDPLRSGPKPNASSQEQAESVDAALRKFRDKMRQRGEELKNARRAAEEAAARAKADRWKKPFAEFSEDIRNASHGGKGALIALTVIGTGVAAVVVYNHVKKKEQKPQAWTDKLTQAQSAQNSQQPQAWTDRMKQAQSTDGRNL